jgi:hypothetical protein
MPSAWAAASGKTVSSAPESRRALSKNREVLVRGFDNRTGTSGRQRTLEPAASVGGVAPAIGTGR